MYSLKNDKIILVIDDKKELIVLVEVILETSGYKVIGTSNSSEALTFASEIQPILIILDIMMPKMNGWEVLKKIRETPDIKDIPVIVLSVKTDFDDIKKAEQLGVMAVIRKPFEPSKLIDAIENILNRKEGTVN